MKKKIIFIEQYFYPEGGGQAQISRDIVLNLKKKDNEIIVLCGDKPYHKASLDDKFYPSKYGIKIIYIPVIFESRKFILRFQNYLFFCIYSFLRLLFINNISLIISQTNPPGVIVVSALISFLKRIPFIIISMDLYPEVLIKNIKKENLSYIYKFFTKVFNRSYCQANKVVSLGKNMTFQLLAKGILLKNIVTIPNWATGNLTIHRNMKNKLEKKWGVKKGIKILYSGNLGIAHEFETIFQGIKSSNLKPEELQTIFVGFGSRLAEVIELSKLMPYESSILIRSYVKASEMPLTMSLASMGLVTLRENFSGLVFPSKFAGYLARGIAILYIGPDSEISEIINKYEIGFCFKNGESERLSNFLINLNKNQILLNDYGINAKNFYEENMSSKIGLEKYQNLVSKYI
tara:strand:- start:16948 stop:18159 length:1212 start_codon:yes stop_codon:yes gene_type:complete